MEVRVCRLSTHKKHPKFTEKKFMEHCTLYAVVSEDTALIGV